MYYSRPTLISNWHYNREAEPKDYDYKACPEGKKKLSKSTYKHFGTYMDDVWRTTTESQMSQCLLKNKDTAGHVIDVTNTILPRHRPGHNQVEFYSTYALEYQTPWDYRKETSTMKSPTDSSPDYRKPRSQFTDTADYRRVGRNTWQDESGVYSTQGGTSRAQGQISNPVCP
ncbi:protein C9orf135 homolog isoform X3 [Esox lucius]|uniref:protein C9orf135 homolog isoform X3 n=1 Tax=Esox lucius TaxID=8010 RepID=UPI0009732B91|nr:protein C9orf135 homolog isoform X3 [Esox lucius]